MATTTTTIVFVPGVGFRPSDTLVLREPLTEQHDEWTVTVERAASAADGVQVALTIGGPFKTRDSGGMAEIDFRDFVQVRDRSGAVVSSERQGIFPLSYSVSHAAGSSLSFTANLPALPTRDPELDLLIGDPLPVTVIPLTLAPLAEFAIPARTANVAEEHHGVVITAHAVARDANMTAVLLHATLAAHPRKRFMRGLGSIRAMPREAPGISVIDDAGTEVACFAATHELSPGHELRMITVAAGLSPAARSATVLIPYVTLSEYLGDPVKVPVPFEGEITLGDDRATVKVGRSTMPRTPRGTGAGVSVEVTGSWQDDRRLLYAESMSVGAHRGGVGFRAMPSEPPIMTYAEDPDGKGTEVALESPVIQLRGPWRLPVDLP